MAKQLVSSEDEAKEKGTGEKPAIQPDLSVHELPKDAAPLSDPTP